MNSQRIINILLLNQTFYWVVPKSRNSVAEYGNSVDGKRKAERLLKVGISGKTSKNGNLF
jgi:hypothetical protein